MDKKKTPFGSSGSKRKTSSSTYKQQKKANRQYKKAAKGKCKKC